MANSVPQFFVGRAGRMVRLVVGSPRPPAVPFFVEDAPTFGAAPELRVAWDGRHFDFTDDGKGVLRGSAHHDPFLLEVESGEAEVFGFGAANGAPTRNASRFRVMNLDTLLFGIKGASYASFPMFFVRTPSLVMGVLVVSSYPLDVEVGGGKVRLHAADGAEGTPLDLIVFRGTPVEMMQDVGALLGRSFLPPAWALGFHQSRWSYKTRDEVLAIAHRFRDEDLPADVIHLDIHYMDQYRVFTFNPKRFPDPTAMHRELSDLGFRTLAIVDPGVSAVPGYPVYDRCLDEKLLLTRKDGSPYQGKVWPGKTVFPDFSEENVRHAWASFHKPMFDVGVGGFWNDMNDPVLRMGTRYNPLDEDVRHTRGSHHRLRNQYANHMAQATVHAFKTQRPGVRPFVLTRSGFLGVQRHAAMWTGDNFGTWEQLQENLHMVVNLGLCGVALVGADVGGFGGRRGLSGGVKWRPPAELFVRWMELGALMPFFRVHCVLYAPHQEPWSFGEKVLKLSREILRQRYRMLPLLYRLALEAQQTGIPMVRPLWMHFSVPPGKGMDQFLLGESMLAAPVMENGATSRSVWLPPGTWVDFFTGQRHDGESTITVDAPLGRCPLFRRAGHALWLAQAQRNAEDTLRSNLSLEVDAPVGNTVGTGSLFLDTGSNDDGRRFLMDVSVENQGNALRVVLGRLSDTFTPAQTEFTLRAPTRFTHAEVDGVRVALTQEPLSHEGRDVRAATVRVALNAREIRLGP